MTGAPHVSDVLAGECDRGAVAGWAAVAVRALNRLGTCSSDADVQVHPRQRHRYRRPPARNLLRRRSALPLADVIAQSTRARTGPCFLVRHLLAPDAFVPERGQLGKLLP